MALPPEVNRCRCDVCTAMRIREAQEQAAERWAQAQHERQRCTAKPETFSEAWERARKAKVDGE